MLVSALMRQVQAAGGFAAVIHRGDAVGGAIILDCVNRGERDLVIEKYTDFDGNQGWRLAGPPPGAPQEEGDERLARRVKNDPDLWIVELDIPQAERFAAEIIALT
jgi:hypothetical protein